MDRQESRYLFICTTNFVMNTFSLCRKKRELFVSIWCSDLNCQGLPLQLLLLGYTVAVIYSGSQRHLQVKRGSPVRRMWQSLSRKLIPSAGIQRCVLIAVRPCRMRVLALCFQIDILVLESRPASLKVRFFLYCLTCLIIELISTMVWLFLMCTNCSASRTVFENQVKENAGGKWIKHQLFCVENKRTAVCAVSSVMEYIAAICCAWVCAVQQGAVIRGSGALRGGGSITHFFTASEIPAMGSHKGTSALIPSGSVP